MVVGTQELIGWQSPRGALAGAALPVLQVVPARAQMASSLGFHIILACMGIAFPAIVMIVHYRGLRYGDQDALLLARRWSKVMAVLVAVGAVRASWTRDMTASRALDIDVRLCLTPRACHETSTPVNINVCRIPWPC